MQIHRGLDEFVRLQHGVVTSGTFDGVHLGHQKILHRLKTVADHEKGESVLITYWPHPRLVLYPEQPFRLLSSIEEKARLLEQLGVDHLVIIPFTRAFSQMSSEDFVRSILVEKIGTKKLIIGYNHRFGKNRAGSFEELRKNTDRYGFQVEEISKQTIDQVSVSSTKIRKALEEGRVEVSNEFLGRPYDITGIVVPGDQRGRSLGFPTANVHVEFRQKLIPANGIYAVKVHMEGTEHGAMANIGFRPTFRGTDKRIEVHIFDFDRNIYQEKIRVSFLRKLRSEKKFDGPEALIRQLANDRIAAEKVLKKQGDM